MHSWRLTPGKTSMPFEGSMNIGDYCIYCLFCLFICFFFALIRFFAFMIKYVVEYNIDLYQPYKSIDSILSSSNKLPSFPLPSSAVALDKSNFS